MLVRIFVFVLLVVSFIGCASQSGYRPTLDPYGDSRADRISQDLYECESLAHQASRGVGSEAAKGGLVGGAIGALGGAILGGLSGNPGKGAIAGATVGSIGGATSQGVSADQRFINAYRNCMINRGHNVID